MTIEANYDIFIVDKDLKHGQTIKDHLSNHTHYTFHLFTNTKDCLEKMELKPALIFLDYELDENPTDLKEGIEFLKILKQKDPKADVVLFSGHEKIEVAQDALTHGAYDFIVKSEVSHLRAENIILKVLHRHQLQDEKKRYKTLFIAAVISISVLIIGAIALYSLGIIVTDNVGGPMF
jgi:two-component system OmpR family response regulator